VTRGRAAPDRMASLATPSPTRRSLRMPGSGGTLRTESSALLATGLLLVLGACTANPCQVRANPCQTANPCQAARPREHPAHPAEPVDARPAPPPPGHDRWRFVGAEGALRLEETVRDGPWITVAPDGTIRARIPPSETTRQANAALAPGGSAALTVEHGR
jgi:hypothetical protein